MAPVTGDYFVAATAFGGPIPVLYSITVEDIPDTIPASIATPATLAVGETQTVPGNNAGSTNNDWFAIDLVAGQSYVLATSNITGRVYFADAGGAVVAIEGFFGGGGQQAHFTATETGRFYAGTQHSSGTSYQLSLLAIADDHGDTAADAGSLTVGTPVNGRWESGGDDDAYAVVLDRRRELQFRSPESHRFTRTATSGSSMNPAARSGRATPRRPIRRRSSRPTSTAPIMRSPASTMSAAQAIRPPISKAGIMR